MNRVIVTGGNGFIGRHIVKKILSNKLSSIAIIANTSIVHNDQFLDEKNDQCSRLKFYTVDIRDKKTISDIFLKERPDTCIHLAAKISVADSIKNPEQTIDVNVNGTLNVLDVCHNSNVNNFIFASSAAVYGDVKELPISEKASLNPLSPYGTSKKFAEQHVVQYHKLKKIPNAISFRIFNVYGTGNASESDVISKFAARLSEGLPPIIYGDGNHTRDFISVDDVADGILLSIRLMENKYNGNLNSPPVFNMGSGRAISINELARKMISISGLDLEPIYERGNQDSRVILHSYANMTKTKRVLQFVAKKNLEAGLKDIIEPLIRKRK